MSAPTLVAGIDSSTQSCKVTIRDLDTGAVVRSGHSPHAAATIVDPDIWWTALLDAVRDAGDLRDVSAISVAGQQHTPVFLDAHGDPTHPSPLWNDVGSHPQMVALNEELGRDEWIRRTGLPLSLSDTVVKLRWLRDRDAAATRRTAAVAVVHDWLTWRLMGHGPEGDADISALATDRSEASGTGYWSGEDEAYTPDLFVHAFGKDALRPAVLGPLDHAGVTGRGLPGIGAGIPVGVGAGDNAAAALALGLDEGDAVMSLGTSGVVYARTARPVHDYAGYVCSYADATGDHLPLVATLNAARNLRAAADLLGCTFDELSSLALQAPRGSEGLTILPYFEGERTPDLPHARGALLNATLSNLTRPNVARAMVEGTVASQIAMIDALELCGVRPRRLLLIGGAARSIAIQEVVRESVPMPVSVPEHDEYVARGAAAQAAGTLTGAFPAWPVRRTVLPVAHASHTVAEQHRAAQEALGYLPPQGLRT